MSDKPLFCSGAPSGLLGTDRRTIRFIVSSADGSTFPRAEFYGLDRARLHAWALGLDGHSSQIVKQLYDTMHEPAKPLGSAVLETWDERSTFLILNAALKRP